MILRTKSGTARLTVVDKSTQTETLIKLSDYLTPKQQRSVAAKPDFIWQFAQRLKQEYARKGQDVSVFARVRVSVNGKPRRPLVNPEADLAAVPWEPLKHSNWLLPSN
jgi:vitamin K-dependent gamma-carboxylase